MIALIDYGAGNLTSVRKALAALGAGAVTVRTQADIAAARGLIVPGVGHFEATRAIADEWRQAIEAALARGAALLGICLGMQWLFEGSSEAPAVAGLGVFPGLCQRLPERGSQDLQIDPTPFSGSQIPQLDPTPFSQKVPHVGWNSLRQPQPTALLAGVPQGAQVYFTHSYAAPLLAETAATTTYGVTFTSAIERGRVAGVQFHPEKSGDVGLRILRNWLDAV